MSDRPRHPKKEVEAVLRELEELGWTVHKRDGKGHAWGLLRCPEPTEERRFGEFCQMSIWSTPKNPSNHAAKLRQKALGCIVGEAESDDG